MKMNDQKKSSGYAAEPLYAHAEDSYESQSLAGLIKELRDETLVLMRQEIALIRSEMGEKISLFTRNGVYLAAGAVTAFAGLIVFLMGVSFFLQWLFIAAGLSTTLSAWIAALLVGTVVLLIGYGLIQKAISAIKKESVVPQKTMHSLKEDKEWIRDIRK